MLRQLGASWKSTLFPRKHVDYGSHPDAWTTDSSRRDAIRGVSEAHGPVAGGTGGEDGVSYPRVNELIHGKRGVTPDTALRLEQLFGMEAQFWLNLQLAWDLYEVKHSSAVKEIQKIKPLISKAS